MDILRNFGIQPTLLLAQIVNFLIILFLLQKFFYKPIIKILESRKKNIEESLKNADLIEEKLKKAEERSAQIIKETQKNAQELISNAKLETQRIADQAGADSRRQIEEANAQAQAQIQAQKAQLKQDLEKETLQLVIGVARKVLGRTLRESEKAQITKSAASELQRKVL